MIEQGITAAIYLEKYHVPIPEVILTLIPSLNLNCFVHLQLQAPRPQSCRHQPSMLTDHLMHIQVLDNPCSSGIKFF